MKKILVFFSILCSIFLFSACGDKELVAVSGVNFYESEIVLGVGETETLKVKVFPVNATNQNVSYETSNESVVTVDQEGVVTMHSNQTASITVRTEDGGFVASCVVNPKIAVTDLNVDPEMMELVSTGTSGIVLSQGQEKQLRLNISPANATLSEVVFSTNDDILEIVDARKGVIRGKALGQATVTIKYTTYSQTGKKEYTKSCVVFVAPQINRVECVAVSSEVAVNSNNIVLDNATNTVEVKIGGYNNNTQSKQKLISFYSSDESIFTVAKTEVDDLYATHLNITPHLGGEAYLYVATDAIKADGKPLLERYKVVVDAEVSSVTATPNLHEKIGDVFIAELNQVFSIDVGMMQLGVGDVPVSLEGVTRDITYTANNGLIEIDNANRLCKVVGTGDCTITVNVPATAGSLIVKTCSFNVSCRQVVNGISVKADGIETNKISVSSMTSLHRYIAYAPIGLNGATIAGAMDRVKIVSSNSDIVDETLDIKAVGTCTITFSIETDTKTFIREVVVEVYQSVVKSISRSGTSVTLELYSNIVFNLSKYQATIIQGEDENRKQMSGSESTFTLTLDEDTDAIVVIKALGIYYYLA